MGLRRVLCQLELEEFELIIQVFFPMFLKVEIVQTLAHLKQDSLGSIFSKSFYKAMDPIIEVKTSSALVWRSLALPKVEAFCWLATLASYQ